MSESVPLPYTRDCFACGDQNPHGLGLRPTYEDGQAVARFTPPAEMCGYRGIVHGGILSTVLDEVMGWAPAYERRRMCMAAEITVRFVKPVPVGTPLVVTGKLAEDKRRLWICEGEIRDEAGTVYAKARGTYIVLSVEEGARIEAEILVYPPGVPRLFGSSGISGAGFGSGLPPRRGEGP